jgi:hypothetical protein
MELDSSAGPKQGGQKTALTLGLKRCAKIVPLNKELKV